MEMCYTLPISTILSQLKTLWKRGVPRTTSFWSVLFVLALALFGTAFGANMKRADVYQNEDLWGFGGPVQKPETIAASAGATPPSSTLRLSEPALNGVLVADNTAVVASSNPLSNLSPIGGGLKEYKVRRGDTITSIAVRFQVSEETILRANPGVGSRLSVGQKLLILPVSGIVYHVRRGDTLQDISSRYHIDSELIKKYNPNYETALSNGSGSITLPYAQSLPSERRQGLAADVANLPDLKNYFSLPAIGWNWGELHDYNAIDIANQCGTPVNAAAEGLVISDESLGSGAGGWNNGYGIFVLVEHPNRTRTRYAHLAKALVKPGDYVTQGETIGLMGNTGNTHGPTGCHLHFEVYGAKNPFAVTK